MRSEYSDHPERIRTACRAFESLEVEDVIGAGSPRPYFMPEQRERVRGVLFLVERLRECDFDNIPDERLVPLAKALNDAHAHLLTVRAYAQRTKDNLSRDNILNGLTNFHVQLYELASPLIAFSAARGSDLIELERQAREVRDRMRELESEGERVLTALRAFSIKDTVSKQSDYFEKQADSHRSGAKLWMWFLGVIGIVIVGLSCLAIVSPVSGGNSPLDTVTQWLPRLAIASVLFWGISLCARNYRAHRHNEVVNRHRALSLKTFNVFVTATEDAAVKSAVLAQAASTIFSAVPSGYSPEHADPLPHVTAVELLQRLGKP